MTSSLKRKELLTRLQPFLSSQRFCHIAVNGRDELSELQAGIFKKTNWITMDSRSMGIKQSMISLPAFIVLKILQSKGHQAYLVGGCVRDLLLKRTPKDFDVITTAELKQVRKQFYRSQIVGKRFPICIVHVKGSVIEVSSFQTLAKCDKEREKLLNSQTPEECDKSDLLRWRNSMHRDFTVNSLFFDPFVYKIYDYANGMKDILGLKLRTLLPAQLSFTEDSARILRGLRIAARLSLSLTKDTETAIYKLASSISSLAKTRISMELNYMLSYGAAEPSLRLLQRFHLLDLFLPFHAACISQQATTTGPVMLMVSLVMLWIGSRCGAIISADQLFYISLIFISYSDLLKRLFFHLDRLVACDRPSDSKLWIGLLAFHMALVNNPQHPHVVFTFASVLYHRMWKEGVEFARQYSQAPVIFVPETSLTCSINSDDELAERVNMFSLLVQNSVDALTEKESLFKAMTKFPDFPCSGLVFVSPNKGKSVKNLFDVPAHEDLKSEGRKSFKINYDLLGDGDIEETRLALGKIILDTMSYGVRQNHLAENNDGNKKRTSRLSSFNIQQDNAKKQKLIRNTSDHSDIEATKKHYKGLKGKHEEMVAVDRNLTEKKKYQKISRRDSYVASQADNLISSDNSRKENHKETKEVFTVSNIYESITDDNVTTKGNKMVISLIEKKEQYKGLKGKREEMVAVDRNLTEKKKYKKISKKDSDMASEADNLISRDNSRKESHEETKEVFTVSNIYESTTTKGDKMVISLIEKKECENVAEECDDVANKGCKSMSHGNASTEQEDLLISPPPQKSLINLMKVFKNGKHGKRTKSSKVENDQEKDVRPSLSSFFK